MGRWTAALYDKMTRRQADFVSQASQRSALINGKEERAMGSESLPSVAACPRA